MEKTYGYTEDGMLSTISYSSQNGKLCTEQLVYRNGTLTGVYLDDGTCVYSYSEEDRHGQLTRIATGEYDRRYEYDEWGFPTARRILYGDGKVLMDQRYEFDAATGNLKSRQDALRNRAELFEYDALQRLTLYAGKKVEYTPDGNIVRKGDAGEMVYTNPNRPYAVTGNTLMAGGSFLNALGNGTMGAFSGAICGGALGGVIGGGTAIIKGQNFWHGNAIAQGRGMFSWKNTAVGETGSLNSVPEAMPDAMPKTPKISEPTSTSGQASEMSIENMSQPQHDYTRFIVEPNGITHDLKPTIDRIYSGKLYTFRHDGTIYHNDKGLLPPLLSLIHISEPTRP